MQKENLVIFGTGKFAEVAHSYFSRYSNFNVVAFVEEMEVQVEKHLLGLRVHSKTHLETIFDKGHYKLFIAIGYRQMNGVRERIFSEMKQKGYSFANFIHPSVEIWPSNLMGENCFIFENNVIQPFVSIGDNNIFWSGNHIGHHTHIGNHNFFSSHVVISGNCDIKDNCFFGVNATVHDGLKIAKGSLIAAGANVSKKTEENGVYLDKFATKFSKKSNELNF